MIGFLSIVLLLSCQIQGSKLKGEAIEPSATLASFQGKLDTATFAGGCFWCIEASFEQIEGVVEAISGYSGGEEKNADYKKVSAGYTKHAEAVQIYFDPTVIDFETLLDVFFTAHDPTQLNRQGPDVGTQYRSEIFYHDEAQMELAKSKISALQGKYGGKIVTKLSQLKAFYPAEEYHQDFERKNPNNGYIRNVSKPKIDKVASEFSDLLKKE